MSLLSTVPVGAELPSHAYHVRRADLVRYAGASGDFNPLHFSDHFARSLGLPGVIAHGMFTMALAGRALTAWAGGPEAVLEYGARFSNPVIVPDDDAGTVVEVSGVLTEQLDDGTVVVSLQATCEGQKVLGAAKARVRLIGQDATQA